MLPTKTRDGRCLIPDTTSGFNWFIDKHNPVDNGCLAAYMVLEGIVPKENISCVKHCPFPDCISEDHHFKQRKWFKGLVYGFRSGLEYRTMHPVGDNGNGNGGHDVKKNDSV